MGSIILQTLRGRGIQASVDNFGTGFFDLGYPNESPLDILKISTSFVRQVASNPDDSAIVTATIGMGQSINLWVIAKGVETQDVLRFLKDNDCEEAQGHCFSIPVSKELFTGLLKDNTPYLLLDQE